jgi:beta-N-acetylhexosaminidase
MKRPPTALYCLALLILTACFSCRHEERGGAAGKTEIPVGAGVEIDREDPSGRLFSALSTRQKIGQLMIVDLGNEDGEPILQLSQAMKETLEELSPGGVVFYGANLDNPEQVRSLAKSIIDAILVPPFLAIDHEGGVVDRLDDSGNIHATDLPSAAEIGRSKDPQMAYKIGVVMGSELSALGINMNFAPVADVLSAPGSVIGSRSYGTDPVHVAEMVRMTVRGLQNQGVSSVLKHFPGHGAAIGDTHTGLVYLDKEVEELLAMDLVPFAAGADEGADGIMAAHIVVPSLGTVPATLSHDLLTGILREGLGFDGLIITDSLTMKAVSGIARPGVEAIRAGADILLRPGDAQAVRSQILSALADGSLTLERIDESVRRILRIKLERGIGRKPATDAASN